VHCWAGSAGSTSAPALGQVQVLSQHLLHVPPAGRELRVINDDLLACRALRRVP